MAHLSGNDLTSPDGAPLVAAVTGVTGYVGGRLVPELLEAGFAVRGVARRAERLRDRPWRDQIEVAEADVGDLGDVREALRGADVAYYLVHALSADARFAARDRRLALTFAQAAREAGVRRIVYLGGMHPPDAAPGALSAHLESRREVGEILLASGVPTAVLQAAVIIGSGSASFEMMRHITERLPAMITPRWVRTRIQPIAIRDVLRYLTGAATMPLEHSRTFDIAGPDVLTYAQMMRHYARVAGLRRRVIVAVPVLTPSLSSHWVGLVTPVPASIARPLVESLVHEVVASEQDIRGLIPDPPEGLIGFDRAVEVALTRIKEANVTTRWSSAVGSGSPSDPLPTDPEWAGGSLYRDERETHVDASVEHLWDVLESLGGETGWHSWPLAWRLRGLMDRLGGGPGLRRGRRDSLRLRLDDAVDFWRVEELDRGRMLRLRAEMRLPGLAWLEFTVQGDGDGSLLRQRAVFHPHGLAGHAYWWAVAPFHGPVFGQMIAGIAQTAEAAQDLDASRAEVALGDAPTS